MYVCGITAYDYCHIGHARVLAVFDTVARCLRMLGYKVIYTRNITDIDDKILARASRDNTNYNDVSERFIRAMHEDCRNLGLSEVSFEPRATEYMEQIIAMIQVLLDKGYAYTVANGDVYYDIKRFANYGQLSGQKVEALIAGVRIMPGEQKKHPADFALWKGADATEVGWKAPWSYGRPGWHIECSAMSKACLGDTFDIHGGGPDLVFPHHENEIAQSEAANQCKLASIWMHAGAVRVADGEDMSKSKGNFVRLRDVLGSYHPEILRYYLLASHYRSAIEYDERGLRDAGMALERLYRALPDQTLATPNIDADEAYTRKFIACVEDDFNVPEALAVLFELARKINKSSDTKQHLHLGGLLKTLANIFGLLQDTPDQFMRNRNQKQSFDLSDEQIERMIIQRNTARKNGDYELGDRIREQLTRAGVLLEDHDQRTTWHRKLSS